MKIFGSNVTLDTLFKLVGKAGKISRVHRTSGNPIKSFYQRTHTKRIQLYTAQIAKRSISHIFRKAGMAEAAEFIDLKISMENKVKSKSASIICG